MNLSAMNHQLLLSICNPVQQFGIEIIVTRLVEGFQSLEITTSEPELVYQENQLEKVEWKITKKDKFLGIMIFGKKDQDGERKFWFMPGYLHDFHPLLRLIPVQPLTELETEVYFWNEQEVDALLYSSNE